MSLPDTVFIFVLALIIFGPKKLPEIGRQLGKLVGEFRRASNEFKFQIEEELRQAELSDRKTIAPAKKELETSTSAEPSTAVSDSPEPDVPYSEGALPVGQHPNIDTVNREDLSPAESTEAQVESVDTHERSVAKNDASQLEINPAAGAEPRTTSPYSNNPEPADPYATPTVADVTHG
jgi:sec-independent protein translocase protein TatB